MKYALSALSGASVSTLAVVLAGHWPALLVALGFAMATGLYVGLFRLIGCERLLRWLSYGSGIAIGSNRQSTLQVTGPGQSYADAVAGRTHYPSGKSGSAGDPQRQFSSQPGISEKRSSTLKRRPNATRPAGIHDNQTMLPMVAQEVLSALMNLNCTFQAAERAVIESYDGGESFDELFRKAVSVVNQGKGLSRKAVA